MGMFFLRLTGGVAGFLIARVIVFQTLLASSGGEGNIAVSMWYWSGGWMIVLSYYFIGGILGFWGIIPLINGCGRLIQYIRPRK